MKNIIDRFVLDSNGITTLTRLDNIIDKKRSILKDNSFNMLLVYEDIREARLFVEKLGDYIEKRVNNLHAYSGDENEVNESRLSQKWRNDAAALFIYADNTPSLDQRRKLGSLIQQIPEVIFCMCISTTDLERALKCDDHLYYRVFSEHIHIDCANASVITSRFLEDLRGRGYETTDAFVNDIKEYISVVYPKADLKNDEFIDDLRNRILRNHYGNGNETMQIGESSVPYYVKPEITQNIPSTEHPIISDTQKNATKEETVKKSDIAPPKNEPYKITLYPFPIDDAKEKLRINLQADTSDKKPDMNILICSISLLPRSTAGNYYYSKIPNTGDCPNRMFIFEGISQLEPGTKYMLNKLAMEGKRIDRIILYCSYKSHHDKYIMDKDKGIFSKTKDGDDKSGFSSADYYIGRMRNYMKGKESFIKKDSSDNSFVELLPIPDEEKLKDLKEAEDRGYITVDDARTLYFDSDNKWALDYQLEGDSENINNSWIYTVKEDMDSPSIDTLTQFYNLIEKECKSSKVHIYLDAQGGMRSFFNLYYSLFSMFDESKVVIEDVCATQFEPNKKTHPICDVTDEYRTIKLVSAINAFSHYGRGDLLLEYFSRSSAQPLPSDEQMLLNSIQKVSESISISNPNGFYDGLSSLRIALNNLKTNSSNSYLALLKNDIQLKYGPLLTEEEFTPLEIIRWCNANKFTQQALAFIEDKMPAFILSKILPTEISDNTDGSSVFRQIEAPVYAEANLKLIKNIKGSNHKAYNALSNTVLHNVIKLLIENENDLYVKNALVCLFKKIMPDTASLASQEIKTVSSIIRDILGDASACHKDDLIKKLTRCIIAVEKINLTKLINVHFRQNNVNTSLSKKYFDSKSGEAIKRYYTTWDNTIQFIDNSYSPTDAIAPEIFTKIKSDPNDCSIRDFYLDFYNFVYGRDYSNGYSIAYSGSNQQDLISIKLAFIRFSEFHKQIIKIPEATNILLEDFASTLLQAAKQRKQELNDKTSALIRDYCRLLGISITASGNLTIADLSDIFRCLYNEPRIDILSEVENKITDSTYTATTSKTEYEELTIRPLKYDNGALIDEDTINKYCAFREHEYLRGSNQEFVPMYWDFRIIKNFNDMLDLSHGFHFYSTVIGKTGEEDGDQITICMTTPDDKVTFKMSYYSQDKDLLDLYLRLHVALKQERNNSSHAADSELRLPFSVIEAMISQYISISDELLNH